VEQLPAVAFASTRERGAQEKHAFPHEREPERGCAVTGTYPAIRMDAVLSTHGPGDVQVTNICSPGLDLATNLGWPQGCWAV